MVTQITELTNWTLDGQPVRVPHDAMLAERRSPDAPTTNAGAYFDGGVYKYEHELVVQDLVFSDAASGRALLGFFAGYGMLSTHLLLRGGPAHPLLMLLEQQRFECTRYEYSMNRVVDVAAALAARGYNPQLACELELTVTADPVFDDNVGCFRVAVREGRAEVTRVGEPGADALSLDVRALASLYSGFFSPSQLALTNAVGGTARGLELAALVFAGPTAAMPDMF